MSLSDRTFPGYEFWFGQVNSRPLNLFRIGFALVLLKEALFHLPLAEVFYSDAGVVPRAAVWQLTGGAGRLSLMDLLPASWMATLVFLLWAAVAVCLLIGFRTRLMVVLNFVLVISIYQRNPFVVNGADDILRLLSFWIMFIPLNHHYAVDAVLARRAGRTPCETTDAFPVRLIQLQIALVYLGAGIFKLLGEPWLNGSALSYVMQLDSWLLPPGKWLAANGPDWLLSLMTYGVVVIEITFPVLVFVPVGQPILRILGLGLAGLMHLGIALCAPLVEFLLVLGVSYLLFFSQIVPTAGPIKVRLPLPFATHVFLGLMMILVLWKNADNFRRHDAMIVPMIPNPVAAVLNATGLNQSWDLFSPSPIQVDWAIAVPGTFEDRTAYDIRTGEPLRDTLTPISIDPAYRWKQLELTVAETRAEALLDAWSHYYCRLENAPGKSSGRLVSVQIRLMYRYSHAPGQLTNPIESDVLWMQMCNSDWVNR